MPPKKDKIPNDQDLPPQANKPTEQEKLSRQTKYKHKGKLKVGNQEKDIEITTVTTPNATGGYDTVVALPSANPLKAGAEEPGG
jgi:hypothetical protein